MKTIIFDVDGVLLHWVSRLPFFCKDYNIDPSVALSLFFFNGHADLKDIFQQDNDADAFKMFIKYHDEHAHCLNAYPDAVHYFKDIAAKYNIVALTKFGTCDKHVEGRRQNLESYFPGMISELICIDPSLSKYNNIKCINERYDVVALVDDLTENLEHTKDFPNIIPVHLNRNDPSADIQCMSEVLPFIESTYLPECKEV